MPEDYKPALKYAIITKELDEEKGTFRDTLVHIFYGDTMDEIQGIIKAHRNADQFFNGSFIGNYKGIILKNEIVGLV